MDAKFAQKKVAVTMYYYNYERQYGDGFYPQLKKSSNALNTQTRIIFEKVCVTNMTIGDKNIRVFAWAQMNDVRIRGLDGDCGPQLLSYLNTHDSDEDCPKLILASNMTQIYPKNK